MTSEEEQDSVLCVVCGKHAPRVKSIPLTDMRDPWGEPAGHIGHVPCFLRGVQGTFRRADVPSEER